MEIKLLNLRLRLWLYFNVGKYPLGEGVYEKRVAFDFFIRGRGFSLCRVFGVVNK